MNYNQIKILLYSADLAYREGRLSKYQYLKILDDCSDNLKELSSKFLKLSTDEILKEYMNL